MRARSPSEPNPPARVSRLPTEAVPDAAASLQQLLQQAAERVAGGSSLSDVDVRAHVDVLCRAVRQASGGMPPNLGTLPSYVPARRLLDGLRSEFLALASQAPLPGPAGMIAVLRGMETVREGLEADAAQRLASRIASPDALEMIVAIAHDMRSPLTSVLFLVDALRNGHSGPVTPHQERQLLLVYGAVFALSSLASDLLDLARGGDRLLDAEPVPFSVTECLHAVRDIVQPIAEEKKLEIELVSPDQADRRVGQPAALTRVLLNLTTNALKFTDKGRVSVRVTELSRTELEFSVRDTGRGVPAGVVDTLFDAFRPQGPSGRAIFSSAGLGLSICQKLVSAMGGALAVQSTVGAETCFSFRLNLTVAPRL